jgi:hypothetical protein
VWIPINVSTKAKIFSLPASRGAPPLKATFVLSFPSLRAAFGFIFPSLLPSWKREGCSLLEERSRPKASCEARRGPCWKNSNQRPRAKQEGSAKQEERENKEKEGFLQQTGLRRKEQLRSLP